MSFVHKSHPLPALPGQQQQYEQYQQYQQQEQIPQQRQRSKSTFSFHSSHSNKSSSSTSKIDLHESPKEKASRKLSTKADPRLAMSEAEPSVVASGTASSLAPLRAIQHRDSNGNPIADPDRSNPTRSRWERPLDTIRSFEAAIDGSYSRKSYMRAESGDSVSGVHRRSTYYGNYGSGAQGYGGRPHSFRPDHYSDNRGYNNGMSRPNSYYDNNTGGNYNNGYYPTRARYPRTAVEPHFNNGIGVNGNQQSYEIATTASGSGSSGDPLGYSTDPSSENSSVDRIQPAPKQEPVEINGFSGFGPTPNVQIPNYGVNGYGNYAGGQPGVPMVNREYRGQDPVPPPVPWKQNQGPSRLPVGKGVTASSTPNTNGARPGMGEKRKSWFGRRFSKN